MRNRAVTGWPLVEADLPPAPDPNYYVEAVRGGQSKDATPRRGSPYRLLVPRAPERMSFEDVAAFVTATPGLVPEAEMVVAWYECGRKERFATFTEADERAWRIMVRTPQRNNGRTTNLSAYECEHCAGYHFGKQRMSIGPVSWRDRTRRALRELAHQQGTEAIGA